MREIDANAIVLRVSASKRPAAEPSAERNERCNRKSSDSEIFVQ